MVETINDEYIIAEALKLKNKDLSGAKSWIIVGKLLFPLSFDIQFNAYKFEKEARNYEEAAKCFGYITMNFPNQNTILYDEINELISALRATEIEITPDKEFYVKMFEHVHNDVQSKILMLVLNHTETDAKQCKSILLILKRFPQVAGTHMPRLLEMICDGLSKNQHEYQEIFEDIIPLMYRRLPDLPSNLICHLFTVAFEYYIRQLNDFEKRVDTNEIWDKIFRVLSLCGNVLKWEKFLPFNKTWSQSVYWDKLIEIIAKKPTGGPHVLFYATTLYVYSLHCYIKSCGMRADDGELNYVLVEGPVTDWKVAVPEASNAEPALPPQISVTTAASKEISKAFVNAAQCWQLLNTDQYQREFSQLLLSLPVAPWISRFLFDLAMYFGHPEEAQKLMSEVNVKNSLVQSVQILSLNLLQGNLTSQGFDCIQKIMSELSNLPQGQVLEHLTLKVPRHIIFIPLTQSALVQYCARAIVNSLSRKIFDNCSDSVLGDLLVLLQMDYARDTFLIEKIFALILKRRSFNYRLFTSYIVATDFLEEFMWIHNHKEDFSMDLSPSSSSTGSRRIGTRGVREDFRLIIKQQMARSNENLTTLVSTFITQEHLQLAKSLFATENPASF